MITVAAGDNVVRLLPPLIVSEPEIMEGVARLERACERLRQSQKARRRLRRSDERGAAFPRPECHSARQLREIIDNARLMKKKRKKTVRRLLDGRALAMIFERPSTRTRVSFELAMRQLGGDALMLTAEEMQLGRGETLADTARVLSRYVDVIMIRTLSHKQLAEFARACHRAGYQRPDQGVPPCQVMRTCSRSRSIAAPSKATSWRGAATPITC